jgi:hypothetical protein
VLAQNLYTKVQVDELLSTYAYRIADGSLSISKIDDLQRQLDDARSIRLSQQAQITGVYQALDYTKQDLADLGVVVGEKQQKLDSLSSLVVGTVTASGISTLRHTTGELESGPISCSVPGTSNDNFMASFGNDSNTIRLTGGAFIDSYKTVEGDGRTLYLSYRSNNSVQTGPKLAIGMSPSNYQLQVNGAANLTSFIEATKFQIGSDQRLKENVQAASLDECTRLVLGVRPVTYSLKASGQAQLGYLANDWDRELTGGYHNSVVGASEPGNEVNPLLALDYSRICPILHGALLAALARIEALENRLT